MSVFTFIEIGETVSSNLLAIEYLKHHTEKKSTEIIQTFAEGQFLFDKLIQG